MNIRSGLVRVSQRQRFPRLAEIFPRIFLKFGLIGFGLLCTASPAVAQETGPVTCSKCHASRDFLRGKTETPDHDALLFVPDSVVLNSRHASLACSDCHVNYDYGFPHRTDSLGRSCQSCHETQGQEWIASVHAENSHTEGDAPTCVRCHGSHSVLGADERLSPTHSLNVAFLCAECHADDRIVGTYFTSPEDEDAALAVERYHETIHGTAMTDAGLTVAATCNDCHNSHLVLPPDSAASSVNRDNIPETCGRCHEGVLEVYDESAHGAPTASREDLDGVDPPVCVDCHTAHGIVRTDEPAWFIGVVEECGECHERLYETYLGTYHGQVTQLGFGLAAKCSDCHTAHDMRPASDMESSVHPVNLVSTCQQCHDSASESFVKYYVHPDPADREHFPILFWPWVIITAYVAIAFALFSVHTILWMVRLAAGRIARFTRDTQSRTDSSS